MNHAQTLRQRLRNLLHSLLIIGAMVMLLGFAAQLLVGSLGWVLVLSAVGAALLGLQTSPRWVMRLYRAQPLYPGQAPRLDALLRQLSERAGLSNLPELYYVPTPVPTAFTSGTHHQAAIALSDGLLRQLTLHELAAAMAHEISHIRHRDTWVMSLADNISRMSVIVAGFGLLSLLLLAPLMLVNGVTPPWLAMLMLAVTPYVTTLMQLALSRTREFDADLGAVELTHDPVALMSALEKIEAPRYSWFARLLLPEHGNPTPSMLRTHPPLQERLKRLAEIAEDELTNTLPLQQTDWRLPQQLQMVRRKPRRHWSGLWY